MKRHHSRMAGNALMALGLVTMVFGVGFRLLTNFLFKSAADTGAGGDVWDFLWRTVMAGWCLY